MNIDYGTIVNGIKRRNFNGTIPGSEFRFLAVFYYARRRAAS